AKIADAFIAPFGGAVADQISRVVGELRHALAEALKIIDVRRAAEMLGILHAQNHAYLARTLHTVEIIGAVHAHQPPVVIGQKAVPRRDEAQRVQVSFGSPDADRDVKRVDARILETLEIGLLIAVGI